MRTSVCVVVKDRRELMQKCLEAVLREEPDEVVVIDNGSTDGTWEDLQAAAARHPHLVIEQDRGSVGRIRNRAAEVATGDVVAFTDSDCEPRPGWLAAGVAQLSEGVGVVQGRTVPATPVTVPWSVTQDLSAFTHLYEACNIFYRRTALLEAGGFNEAIGFFGEDTAAGWNVERAGWTSAWAPDAVVAHVVTTPGYGWHLRRAWFYSNWPALIRAYPEKRALLWKRWFLRRRSAEADLLLLGVVTAGVLTSPWPLVAAAPFVWRHRRSPGKALFDLTVSVALLRGSVRHRTVVL
jgi:glycosyltransferase involved in cell wall biosynthesis